MVRYHELLLAGAAPAEALAAAVAAGSATAMLPATDLCREVDVTRLERQLNARLEAGRSS